MMDRLYQSKKRLQTSRGPGKNATKSLKNHTFEPFSQRVARLKIDPIRGFHSRQPDELDLGTTASHFRAALESWNESNLSENYSEFAQRVDDISDSLPQILHHEEGILRNLDIHIRKGNAVSLEPLLDLVAQLAHDLGSRFMKHFPSVIETIIHTINAHTDIEVVEWCFNSLTWLFKYLSRLLLPDLCPLFNQLAPLLGKGQRQRNFVSRFAAEAFSFIIRRASFVYEKDSKPLQTIISHIFDDISSMSEDRNIDDYQDAVTTILVEAIRGVNQTITKNSKAVLLEITKKGMRLGDFISDNEIPALSIVQDVLVAILSHANQDAISELINVILQLLEQHSSQSSSLQLSAVLSMAMHCVIVRKGQGIQNWNKLFNVIHCCMTLAENNPNLAAAVPHILATFVVSHQCAPVDAALPQVKALESIPDEFFLHLSELYVDLSVERFRTFVLPGFQKFLNSNIQSRSRDIYVLLQRLSDRQELKHNSLKVSKNWENHSASYLKALSDDSVTEGLIYSSSSLLAGLALTSVNLEAFQSLLIDILLIDKPLGDQSEILMTFKFGQLLKFISQTVIPAYERALIWNKIASATKTLLNYESFWSSTLLFAERHSDVFKSPQATEVVKEGIVGAVRSASHNIRLSSLRLSAVINEMEDGMIYEALEVAILIEETEPTIETMRIIHKLVHDLSVRFAQIADGHWLLRVLSSFCFGLLRIHFASVWDDACNCLEVMSSRSECEPLISEVASSWLDSDAVPAVDDRFESQGHTEGPFLNREINSVTARVHSLLISPRSADERLEEAFRRIHHQVPPLTSLDKMQAIRVFRTVPNLADRMSKMLVSRFLGWASLNARTDSASSWNKKDRKDFLSLFASLKNPRALFRTHDVYDALLRLLCHGDAEIQKAAFNAILAWRNETHQKYEEDLLKLLDDAKFRDQLTVFLDVGNGEDALRAEDLSETMPVILRLLYGRIALSGKDERKSNRKAVFGLLSRLGDATMNEFLDIAHQQLTNSGLLEVRGKEVALKDVLVDKKSLFGLMSMLKDLLDTLLSRSAPYGSRLLETSVFALVTADRAIRSAKETDSEERETQLLRSIRNTAFHCLSLLIEFQFGIDWNPHLRLVCDEVIKPRSGVLHLEMTQAVSGILRFIAAIAQSKYVCQFAQLDKALLLDLVKCIGTSAVKEDVKGFILSEILSPILAFCKNNGTGNLVVNLREQYGELLSNIQQTLQSDISKDLLDTTVSFVQDLAELTEVGTQPLIHTIVFFLRQPSSRVQSHTKTRLLYILRAVLPETVLDEAVGDEVLRVVCTSFTFGLLPESRILLGEILVLLARKDEELSDVSALIQDLNSFSTSKLDEPNFEKRAEAYRSIENDHLILTAKQWRPILANCLFFVKDTEEFAIRTSASHIIQMFIDATVAQMEGPFSINFTSLLDSMVLSNIVAGVKGQPELIKAEYLSMLSKIAHTLPEYPLTRDLTSLLWTDEESSFFSNILHIQQHRRQRAMKRLAEEVVKGTLESNNVFQILIPLLEYFIYAPEQTAQSGEAASTIGALAGWIDFNQYRSLMRRYISFIYSKHDQQESTLKLLGHVAKALGDAAKAKSSGSAVSKLARTLPNHEKLPQSICQDFLPPLYKFLQNKDESFVSRRVAVSIVASRIIQVLPPNDFALRFPPLLTDTCNILRSKDQTARDLTRDGLSTICSIAGPKSLGFIVRELRRALQKGFYLHVLGYTVHAILESNISNFVPGDLDYCIEDIVGVVMDDVFGAAGQEKEEEVFMKSKGVVKEVKGKKSFDTMQLIASVTTLQHIVELVQPIELFLLERLRNRQLGQIDELLRRMELGISQNTSLNDRDVLVLCYQLIQQAYRVKNGSNEEKPLDVSFTVPLPKRKRTLKGAVSLSKARGGKIIRFALEITRNALKKHKSLKSPENIGGFLPVIGDALVSDQEEIKISALRLYTSIVGVPMTEIERDSPLYISECIRIIEASQTNADELSQAALKFISTVLRERSNVEVSEQTIAFLLKRIKPDLQVISQQGVAFNLIRSILSRKYIIPEVYAIIDGTDGIAAISIRDHDRTTRDLARGVYFQFLMEYPQDKKRFTKQLAFLNKNLEYEHPEGRQSVLEALNHLLNKTGDWLIDQIIKDSFWPVVSIMINDSSTDCRTMAAGLVKTMFARGDDQWTAGVLTLLKSLLAYVNPNVQIRTALQTWTIYLDSRQGEAKEVDFVAQSILEILSASNTDADENWQLNYYALNTFLKVCRVFPRIGFSPKQQRLWRLTWGRLRYPHSWVQHEAAKLIGQLASYFTSSNVSLKSLPLAALQGIKITQTDLCDLAQSNVEILSDIVTEDLATQVVHNLAFIVRVLVEANCTWQPTPNSDTPLQSPSDSEEPEDSDGEAVDHPERKTALPVVLARLAGILRKEAVRKRGEGEMGLASRTQSSLIPRSKSLSLLAALASSLPLETLTPSLSVIMRPLILLTETNSANIPFSIDPGFKDSYMDLISNAQELMDMLQKKLGTREFVRMMQDAKGRITRKRDERRMKRRIEAVTAPEMVEKRKVQRREKDKIKRKEKGMVARGKRRGW